MLHINTSKIFFPCSLQWTRSSGNGSENSLIIGSSWALKYTTVQPVHNTNNLVWINQERLHRLTWTQALFDKDFAVDLVNQINLQSPLNSRQSEIPHPGRLSRHRLHRLQWQLRWSLDDGKACTQISVILLDNTWEMRLHSDDERGWHRPPAWKAYWKYTLSSDHIISHFKKKTVAVKNTKTIHIIQMQLKHLTGNKMNKSKEEKYSSV